MVSRPTVRAAGGVLLRGDPTAPEVALVHRQAYDDWSLPKGKSKRDEHVLLTALREVAEETGHRPRLGPYLTATRYPVAAGRRWAVKTVRYWAMQAVGGRFSAGREVDELRWLPLAEARCSVDAGRDARVLDAFARAPLDTAPLLLLRNGPTTKRRAGTSSATPVLDGSGRAQAQRLVDLLTGVGAGRLVAADRAACAQMLQPYAEAAGLDVDLRPRLTVAGFRGSEREVTDELRAEAARSAAEGALVVCGQRRVVAGVVEALGRSAGRRPADPLAVDKGGWWLLHHRGGDVVHFERHAPAA